MNFETVQTISHSDAITTLFVFFYILNYSPEIAFWPVDGKFIQVTCVKH